MHNFVTLPSGRIINLEMIAWISAADGALLVIFPAAAAGPHGGGAIHLELDTADTNHFFHELENRKVNVAYLREALKKK